MPMKACIECGRASRGSRCPAHKIRNGSTRSWRSIREGILARDRHRCQQCGQHANEVDHIIPLADGGTDVEGNLRALCRACTSPGERVTSTSACARAQALSARR